ncbi:restriction endonuclease subunit S [Roseateles sp. BYS96W]|uniref:Restriction endonuclease subunit S n=1 Tax=Pelomonas nitida TaxID=3299027 RepID=A0ABW7G6E0_9BURK
MRRLPNGWASTPLGELVSLRTGPFGSALHQSDYVREGTPLVNPMHLVDGRIRPSPEMSVPAQMVEQLSDYKLRSGDVVLGRRGEMGRCAVVSQREEGWLCGTGSLIVRPERRLLDPSYLQRLLTSRSVVDYLLAASVGSTMANLNQQHLLALDVSLPPLAEQTRIVEKLEELLSDLDAGVAELKAAQAKLQHYRQSLLKAAVEGSLTAAWREAHPAPEESGADLLARILRERRARWEAQQLAKFEAQGKAPTKGWQGKYPEPASLDTNALDALPNSWVWASVEQLGTVQLGRQRSPDKLGGANPTPYVRAANIREGGIDLADVLYMDFSASERITFALKPGDVLLTEASGSPEHVGRPAIWRDGTDLYCFQNTVLRFQSHLLSPEFAYFSFLAMQKLGVFRRLSGGVGINHLSAGKFSTLPVPLPPVREQLEIVRLLTDAFALCDRQLAAIERVESQSTAQRQNLLRAAFAGQLVPQDPADEPAAALLARIRAERAAAGGGTRARRGRPAKEVS